MLPSANKRSLKSGRGPWFLTESFLRFVSRPMKFSYVQRPQDFGCRATTSRKFYWTFGRSSLVGQDLIDLMHK